MAYRLQTNEYLETESGPAVPVNWPFMMSLWFKVNAHNSNDESGLINFSSSGNSNFWGVQLSPTGEFLQFCNANNETNWSYNTIPGLTVATGTWYLVHVKWDIQEESLYVNGGAYSQSKTPANPYYMQSFTRYVLGGIRRGNDPIFNAAYDLEIAHFTVRNGALSLADIAREYNDALTPDQVDPSSIIGYWSLENGTFPEPVTAGTNVSFLAYGTPVSVPGPALTSGSSPSPIVASLAVSEITSECSASVVQSVIPAFSDGVFEVDPGVVFPPVSFSLVVSEALNECFVSSGRSVSLPVSDGLLAVAAGGVLTPFLSSLSFSEGVVELDLSIERSSSLAISEGFFEAGIGAAFTSIVSLLTVSGVVSESSVNATRTLRLVNDPEIAVFEADPLTTGFQSTYVALIESVLTGLTQGGLPVFSSAVLLESEARLSVSELNPSFLAGFRISELVVEDFLNLTRSFSLSPFDLTLHVEDATFILPFSPEDPVRIERPGMRYRDPLSDMALDLVTFSEIACLDGKAYGVTGRCDRCEYDLNPCIRSHIRTQLVSVNRQTEEELGYALVPQYRHDRIYFDGDRSRFFLSHCAIEKLNVRHQVDFVGSASVSPFVEKGIPKNWVDNRCIVRVRRSRVANPAHAIIRDSTGRIYNQEYGYGYPRRSEEQWEIMLSTTVSEEETLNVQHCHYTFVDVTDPGLTPVYPGSLTPIPLAKPVEVLQGGAHRYWFHIWSLADPSFEEVDLESGEFYKLYEKIDFIRESEEIVVIPGFSVSIIDPKYGIIEVTPDSSCGSPDYLDIYYKTNPDTFPEREVMTQIVDAMAHLVAANLPIQTCQCKVESGFIAEAQRPYTEVRVSSLTGEAVHNLKYGNLHGHLVYAERMSKVPKLRKMLGL